MMRSVVNVLVLLSCIHMNYALSICKDTGRGCSGNCKTIGWETYVLQSCMKTCGICVEENIAIGKTTGQSSTYTGGIHTQRYSRSKNAVDGNTNSDFNKQSCTHTRNKNTIEWWCVDLGSMYDISYMQLYNRNNNQERLIGFSIHTSETGNCDQPTFDNSPAVYTDSTTWDQLKYTVQESFYGRYVFVSVKSNILTLCEVEIFVAKCAEGYYSSQSTCRKCQCGGNSCDEKTGACLCNPNCINNNCDGDGTCIEGCQDGYYGDRCQSQCPSNCKDNSCSSSTGSCLNGCQEGLYGDMCNIACSNCLDESCRQADGFCNDGCKEGYWGDTCGSTCFNCKYGGCHTSNGTCINGCKEGFYDDQCNTTCVAECRNGCSHKKGYCKDCISDRHGKFCDKICDRFCVNGCMKTTGACNECQNGLYGDFCNQPCNIGCKYKSCSQLDGSCTCTDQYYGTTCSNECSSNCKGSKCNITSRPNEPTCTEECVNGYKGFYCQQTCPVNCQVCDRFGYSCQKCNNGWYGTACELKCSANCFNGCDLSDGKCTSCKPGTFGDFCKKRCSVGCKADENGDTSCNRKGYCKHGCVKGYFGDKCNTQCSTTCKGGCQRKDGKCNSCLIGYFGDTCDTKCSTFCKGGCSQSSGKCVNCINGRYGDMCKGICSTNCEGGCRRSDGYCVSCTTGHYGYKCDKNCSKSCEGGCDKSSGRCVNCIDGYYGDKCNSKCSINCKGECGRSYGYCDSCITGHYGNKCDLTCSKSCIGGCTQNSGNCNSCSIGYYGTKCGRSCTDTCAEGCQMTNGHCNKCMNGYYGSLCYRTCPKNCVNNTCKQSRGDCIQCITGYNGGTCNKPCGQFCEGGCDQSSGRCANCTIGQYGDRCYSKCSPNCKGGCQRSNGNCNSCKIGFYGTKCDRTCSKSCAGGCQMANGYCNNCMNGYYGSRCSKKCPPNCVNDACKTRQGDNDTYGYCINGCLPGWYGPTCQINCSLFCEIPEPEQAVCRQTTGECNNGCLAGKTGFNCSKDCLDGRYGRNCQNTCGFCNENKPCDYITGACEQIGCSEGYTGDTCSEKIGTSSPVAIWLSLLFAVMIIAVVAILLYRWRGKRQRENRAVQNGNQQLSNLNPQNSNKGGATIIYDNIAATTSSNDAVYENIGSSCQSSTNIELNQLWGITQENKKSECFSEQFSKLPKGLCSPHTVALSVENKPKNRYKMICAFDHTRVKLDIENGDPNSDYINACYIKGFRNNTASYVAAQGPTPINIKDFWRMIWKVEAGKIVMLTNLTEMGIIKCTLYWPAVGKEMKFGKISVTTIQEVEFASFTVRTLLVSKKLCEPRTITQYHFTAWPDKQVPTDITALVEFRNKVMKSTSAMPGPIVTHCSAGVGRTGTFLALDYLINEAESENSVDVFNCVLRMRYERVNMVQTLDQYICLHDALINWHTTNDVTIPVSQYHDIYQRLMSSGKLPQYYQSMHKCCLKNDKNYTTAELEENKDKNRFSTVLASDNYRPYLTQRGEYYSDYINAVYLPSYLHKHGYILTQTPLPNTVVDFYRLIYETDTQFVVDLDFNCVDKQNQLVGDYVPMDETIKTYGPFKVSSKVQQSDCDMYCLYKTTITCTTDECDEEDKVVYIYLCNFWRNQTPSSLSPIFHLFEDFKSKRLSPKANRPLLVHCLNGADKSGLLCVLAAMWERLSKEQSVNIMQVITQMRIARPQIIPTYGQFQLCFTAIGEYLDHFSDYSNAV